MYLFPSEISIPYGRTGGNGLVLMQKLAKLKTGSDLLTKNIYRSKKNWHLIQGEVMNT